MRLWLAKSFTSLDLPTTTMQGWLSILLMIALGAGFALVSILLSAVLGPRKPTPEKAAPYECGMPAVGDARERQSVKFYLVAMIFLLFGILSFIAQPIGNTISRHVEHEADIYGLEVTHGINSDPQEAAAHSFQMLGEMSLDYPYPSRLAGP